MLLYETKEYYKNIDADINYIIISTKEIKKDGGEAKKR